MRTVIVKHKVPVEDLTAIRRSLSKATNELLRNRQLDRLTIRTQRTFENDSELLNALLLESSKHAATHRQLAAVFHTTEGTVNRLSTKHGIRRNLLPGHTQRYALAE